MLPIINGKNLYECGWDEIKQIINNPIFKENQYIDYKSSFNLTDKRDMTDEKTKKLDFRSDVCSFANFYGGYLIYGIREKRGFPVKATGIVIENNDTDSFQLNCLNILRSIEPAMPLLRFNFIEIFDDLNVRTGKYVVVVYVRHSSYAPYTFLHDDKYVFSRRIGNGNGLISYMELKRMFAESNSIEENILDFRKSRIRHYQLSDNTMNFQSAHFFLLHMIPDSFLDMLSTVNIFVRSKRGLINISPIIKAVNLNSSAIVLPNVDGIWVKASNTDSELVLYNNGIMEVFAPIDIPNNTYGVYGGTEQTGERCIYYQASVWKAIENALTEYIRIIPSMYDTVRYFAGLTFIGCKGLHAHINESRNAGISTVDRDEIICPSIPFPDINAVDSVNSNLKALKLSGALSLGIHEGKMIDALIKDLYS